MASPEDVAAYREFLGTLAETEDNVMVVAPGTARELLEAN